jgi:hypothetical protein
MTRTFTPYQFKDGDIVEWQVQNTLNVTVAVGGGTQTVEVPTDWSNIVSIQMYITPPLAPLPMYPTDIAVNKSAGVLLEWLYRSNYDIFPTRFDVQYQIDNGAVLELTVTGTPAFPSSLIPIEVFSDYQQTVTWRVRAYGEFGDVGLWSVWVTFWTVGLPPPPVIVQITNSNRPAVHFTAESLATWELEISQQGTVVYYTGAQPFGDAFKHVLNDFLPNGNYLARLRVTNEYSIPSVWGALAFTINVEPPEVPTLEVAYNTKLFNRLVIGMKEGLTVYVYRRHVDWIASLRSQ